MANNVAPDVLVNAVLGKISDVLLSGGDGVLPQSDDHYFAFMSPGIPMREDSFDYAIEGWGGRIARQVDPNNLDTAVGPNGGNPQVDPQANGADAQAARAADARRKYMAAEAFAAMCDLVPDTSGIIESNRINIWQPETRISHAYAMALQFSQIYNVEPDEQTRAKIDRWRGLLQKEAPVLVIDEEGNESQGTQLVESPIVKKYNEKKVDYFSELMTFRNLMVEAQGNDPDIVHKMAMTGPILRMKLDAAYNNWASNGFKDTVERLGAAIASVEGRSFALLKEKYKQDFFLSTLTNPTSGMNFSYTAPAPADFARHEAGWSEFTFDSGSYHSNFKFTRRSTSAGGVFTIGTFGVGGRGGVREANWGGAIDTETFNMGFKLARVPIYRPGINMTFLKSGFWRFDPHNQEVSNTMISDGQKPPNGLMPAVTTDAIFVRDLVLDFGTRNSEFEHKTKEVEGRAGVSWGPFHLAGKHTNARDERTSEVEWSRQGLHVPGMQLLGFLCWLFPKAPNPNPNINDWL